jgi:hypothetical protein
MQVSIRNAEGAVGTFPSQESADRYMNRHSLEEFEDISNRYAIAKVVVLSGQAAEVEGQLLDLTTAGSLVALYEALGKSAQDRFDDLPLQKLVSFAFSKVSLS